VNLRDIEGRSALLLGRAKDNTASAGIGPWIRLFDQTFTERDIATSVVTLDVAGKDGFSLRAEARIEEISRSFSELVEQLMGSHHQYPDGAALFLGTPFAPVDDRDEKGKGFTHHLGDVVTISTPSIGSLCNTVNTSESCEPWSFGIGEFMKNLAQRGLQEV
jgi:fumarylacetoacetate (FAA) hydrolase family protein